MRRVFIGKSCIGSFEAISHYVSEYKGKYKFVIVPLDNGDYRLDFYKEEFSLCEKFCNKLWSL